MLNVEKVWEQICRGRGLVWGLLLYPLSLIYGFISLMLRQGIPQRSNGLKVISVGNLSMGGAGKSPLVIYLAGILKRQKLAVLTRGYAGDEAAMLEEALPGVAIVVDSNRLRAAERARSLGCRVAVLDDGFQRRHELARDLDILVLDWQRQDIETQCLPAGRLREPILSATEADAVLVTHAPSDWNSEALRAGLPLPYQGLRVFRADHQPIGLRSLTGKRQALRWLRGRRVTAVSGIGRPEAFEASLRDLGANLQSLRFSDHHSYQASDLPKEGLIVSTAKDAVKLKTLAVPELEIWILEIEMQVSPKREFEAMILS
jgi:tetraacyldisaccharide 4'-kinase